MDRPGRWVQAVTLLALAAPDGTFVSPNNEMPASVVETGLAEYAAEPVRRIHDVTADGVAYQVQVVEIFDTPEAKGIAAAAAAPRRPIAKVVMARKLSGVLSGLFPGARIVFLFATAIALAGALATMLRARRLTGGAREPRVERVPKTAGQVQSAIAWPVGPVGDAAGDGAVMRPTSSGMENHCGAERPKRPANSMAAVSNWSCMPAARYRSNSVSQVSS